MRMPQFNSNTLNIFTDASITTMDSGEYVGCSGAVAYTGNLGYMYIVDQCYQINRHSTNNNSEMIAVIKGIELALKYRARGEFTHFNLFSDSKICIYGLREWIEKWVQQSPGDVLIGSQNKPVMNQAEILTAVHLILDNNLDIKLYHQKGHMDDTKLVCSLQTFKKSNNIDNFVSNDFISQINRSNDYVDTRSRGLLNDIDYNDPDIKPVQLVQYKYDPNMDIQAYLSLVRA